jgi:hypothetical protein
MQVRMPNPAIVLPDAMQPIQVVLGQVRQLGLGGDHPSHRVVVQRPAAAISGDAIVTCQVSAS